MIEMPWPLNFSAVPDVEVDIEKSFAKRGYELFLLFMLYLNGISIFEYRCGLRVMSCIQGY